MGTQEHKTKVCQATQNPKWNSSMQFILRDLQQDVLCITVFDRDLFSPNGKSFTKTSFLWISAPWLPFLPSFTLFATWQCDVSYFTPMGIIRWTVTVMAPFCVIFCLGVRAWTALILSSWLATWLAFPVALAVIILLACFGLIWVQTLDFLVPAPSLKNLHFSARMQTWRHLGQTQPARTAVSIREAITESIQFRHGSTQSKFTVFSIEKLERSLHIFKDFLVFLAACAVYF